MEKLSATLYKAIQQLEKPKLAEKDILECQILKKLFEDKYIADNFAFSGGASLFKSYNMIQRQGPDIDLVCNDFQELGVQRSKKQLNNFKERFKNYVFDVIKPKINSIINQNQQFMIVSDRDWKLLSQNAGGGIKLPSFPTLHLLYKSEFDGTLEHLSFEITPRKYDDVNINNQMIKPYSTGQAVANIPTVSYQQTFWDKIYALHTNAIIERPRSSGKFSRHYYDVSQIMPNMNLGKTQDLFINIAKYQNTYTTKQIEFPIDVQTIQLLPDEVILNKLEQDYIDMEKDFVGEHDSWTDIVKGLMQLNVKLKYL